MSKGVSINNFIKEYSESIKRGKAALFIGSGLSRPAGYMGWKDILRDCAEEIGLCVDKERDLIALAQFYVTQNKQRTKITNTVKNFFSDKNGVPTLNHLLLAELPITSVWTTNYDRLIERTYEQRNTTYTILTDDKSYRNFDDCAKITIHKIHGDVLTADDVIITRDDYESFANNHDIVLAELKGEMCSRSFLFLGYSFSDTDIQHILTQIRLIHDKNQPQRHFYIYEKVKRADGESDEDFEYKCKRQEHLIADFMLYGINPVLVEDYSEITDILKRINQRVLLKNVLICGSYEEDYGYAKRSAHAAQKISSELIQLGFKIFTGYGKNLGSEIVAGAFSGCTKADVDIKEFNDTVFLFPFPYKELDVEKRKEYYTHLRENMICKTQITIVIAGNNERDNIAKGVMEEVELSVNHGNLIIPIATTGSAALHIWDKINQSGSSYSKTEEFQALSKAINADEIWNTVNSIISKFIADVCK